MAHLPVLTRALFEQMRQRLVEVYHIDARQTLELAGRNLALVAKMMLDDDLADRPIVVVAGRGRNGAGGLVAARHLLNWGAWVQVVCAPPVEGVDDAAMQPLRTLQAMGAPLAWAEEGWELPPTDLVIDAIIGGGLQGAPEGKARDLIQLANSSVAPILSLTLPSGLDADAGAAFTPHVQAAATVAMMWPRQGLLDAAAQVACGDLYLGDVGVPNTLLADVIAAMSGVDVTELDELPPIFTRDIIVRWDVIDGVAQTLDEA